MHPLSAQFAETVKEKGGATVNIQTGESPTSGVMVSRYGSEKQVPGVPSPEVVDSYIDQHKATLSQAGSFMGGWSEHGTTYMDESLNFGDRRKARSFGRENAQRALYDLDADKSMRIRYEPRMSPEGTLFEGFRKAHSAYSRAVSESARRNVELDLERAHYAADEKNVAPPKPQGEQLRLF